MSLADIVAVEITALTKTPTRVGFGVPLIAAYHTVYPERYREYTDVADMITDGFGASDPAVLAATAAFAQNPRPSKVGVGRCANDQTRTMKITPNSGDLRASFDYKVYLEGQLRYYTTDASPTVAEICTGLAAALQPSDWLADTAYSVGDYVANDTTPVKVYRCTTAGTSDSSGGPTGTGSAITDNTCVWAYVGPDVNVTASDDSTYVTVAGDAVSDQFRMYVDNFDILWTNDITADGTPDGIVSDLTAIRVENDDWYGLILCNHGKAVIQAAAAHVETLKKIMIVSSPDSDIAESGTDDLGTALQTAGYARTALLYHYKANEQYPGAAWQGKCLPKDPGSITWKFKTLAGVDYMNLTSTKETNLKNKNVNRYVRISGISMTDEGYSSADEWIDVTRGIDFISARLQEYIFGALANADKIPFTDRGVGTIEGQVWAVLRLAVANDILVDNDNLIVTVPAVADVSTSDKANRILPDVTFNGDLAGAIHKVQISGVVSP